MVFGQKKTLIQNFLLIGPILIAAITALLLITLRTFERASYAVLFMGIIGIVFISIAKWPSLKEGKFMTFGPQEMNASSRKQYFIGYGLITISFFGALGLLLVS